MPYSITTTEFRQTLGQYPTGVAAVTAIHDGEPVGMIVGTFTSVSLDPPLVGFLPDKSSSTWPKIQEAGGFCVNILSSNQEGVCRGLASKPSHERFVGIRWDRTGRGRPLIDGCVAWIECDIDSVTDAGDHVMVMGLVREMGIQNTELPLLFFRGGYGRFSPLSMAAADDDLAGILPVVDLARPHMETLAVTLSTQVTAVVRVADQGVVVASVGQLNASPQWLSEAGTFPYVPPSPTPVGIRFPFRAPLGSVFAAWGSDEDVAEWISRPVQGQTESDMQAMLRRVKRRGYSIGLAVGDPADGPAPTQFEYNPETIDGRPVMSCQLSAPVFAPDMTVPLELTTWTVSDGGGAVIDVDHLAESLRQAASKATKSIATELG